MLMLLVWYSSLHHFVSIIVKRVLLFCRVMPPPKVFMNEETTVQIPVLGGLLP